MIAVPSLYHDDVERIVRGRAIFTKLIVTVVGSSSLDLPLKFGDWLKGFRSYDRLTLGVRFPRKFQRPCRRNYRM